MDNDDLNNDDSFSTRYDTKGRNQKIDECRNVALFMAWFMTVMASLYLIKFLLLELGNFDLSSHNLLEWIYGLGLIVFQLSMIGMMLASIIGIQKLHPWSVFITKWLWGLMLLWPIMMVWRNVYVFVTYLVLLVIVFYLMSCWIDWDLLVPKEKRRVNKYWRCVVVILTMLGVVLAVLKFIVV